VKYLQTIIYPALFLSLLFTPDIIYGQVRIGEKAPGFITSTLTGQRIVFKEYWERHGKKAIVLSFFATWCQPCKEDLKYLQKIRNQYGSQGLQVLSVLTQDSAKESEIRAFLQKLDVVLPVLMDEDGIIGKRYGLGGLPCNFMIDKGGILRAKYLGYSEDVKKDFEKRLKEVLSAP
jgi:peroxiredoxin